MKIMIMGIGGGYYGGLLAGQGNDVTFIARGEHLQVKSMHGDFILRERDLMDVIF
jgi:ketopantoate reductase